VFGNLSKYSFHLSALSFIFIAKFSCFVPNHAKFMLIDLLFGTFSLYYYTSFIDTVTFLMYNFFSFLIIFCAFFFFYGDTPALHSPFFLLLTVFSCFLQFLYCSFASSSYHLLFNVSMLSSFSISFCFVSLIIVLFSQFSLILLLLLFHIFRYFEPIIKFYNAFLFPLWIVKNIHNFPFLIFIFNFYP